MKEIRHSVCALDCPDCCSVLVEIEGDRATRLKGDPAHPITKGFLCAKVTRYLDREYHPQRLLFPQRRVGAKGEGRFERISWDDAITGIATRLQNLAEEHGPECILPYSYAGTMGLLNGSGMDRRFFHRLGASRLDRTICAATGSAALSMTLGHRTGTEPEQFAKSRCIIAWGANILATSVHLWPFIVQARRNGAKFYVIDPLRTKTASLADRHLAIHPGSDAALAMAMMHVIFRDGLEDREYLGRYCQGWEETAEKAKSYTPEATALLTGLTVKAIEEIARDYATLRPASIRLNYGIQRSERGGLSTHAVSLLPAVVGSWKEEGGGLQMTTSGGFVFNRDALEQPDLQQHSSLGRPARILNMSEIGKILEPDQPEPVNAVVVYNSNPVAVAPNQNRVKRGFARDDLFCVVLEQFMTDTATYADYLLPATTFLEHSDLYYAYGHYYLQLARPALHPPGECKSNVEVFRLLAKAMSFPDSCFDDSEDDMMRQVLDSDHPHMRGITLERLQQQRSVRLNLGKEGSPYLPHASGGFGTPSGRCEFHPERLNYVPPEESRHGNKNQKPLYPLELISAKAESGMNSTFGHRDDFDTDCAILRIHESDASTRGIQDGDILKVFNSRGSLTLQACISVEARPGTVAVQSGRWSQRASDGQGINVLTSDVMNDLGGGPSFFSCLVQVSRR
jgi:anaerobic selenocysteine-containing dehydrogenase